ncbi:Acg family FMN-binding oxidoreductase [Bradyrhizobium sp. Ash2021]|uniref:Acg family FMN-binding oxidoreductase n=1 Tax=Bradyrhizobium sp. Ash2021 TaxID=2954771 RepID=UPI002814C291|nr:nitroreductase family protein [Bradyrhizobium sp. Ash2021]WMT73385.1 nitroreductase family protein [Bradyrhizobium sp. Ash2021]
MALTAGAGSVAIGGATALVMNAQRRSGYEDAINSTWRHSDRTDLPLSWARRELVRYASLAANSHNTQPWQFRLSDRSILVLSDLSRRLPSVDPDDHHLFASLGCAVENMIQAARAFGLRAVPSYDPVARGIRVELDTAPPERTDLFDAIPRRQSTRAVYDGRAVPPEHLRLLEAAGNGEGVRMLLFTERQQREDILSYLVAGNSAQMDDVAFVHELRTWIRFSYGEAISTRDGLFSKSTGSPALPGWIGRLIFSAVFTKTAENSKYESQLRSSAGVAVFVSDRNEPAGWVEVGRCCQRLALQATALRLRHAFINQPVEVAAVRGQFATYLGIDGRRPDLVMRFGYGPELPKSLRRPVEQVILEA